MLFRDQQDGAVIELETLDFERMRGDCGGRDRNDRDQRSSGQIEDRRFITAPPPRESRARGMPASSPVAGAWWTTPPEPPPACFGRHSRGHQHAEGAVVVGKILFRDPLHVRRGHLFDAVEVLIDHLVVTEHLVEPELEGFVENRVLAEDKAGLHEILGLAQFLGA